MERHSIRVFGAISLAGILVSSCAPSCPGGGAALRNEAAVAQTALTTQLAPDESAEGLEGEWELAKRIIEGGIMLSGMHEDLMDWLNRHPEEVPPLRIAWPLPSGESKDIPWWEIFQSLWLHDGESVELRRIGPSYRITLITPEYVMETEGGEQMPVLVEQAEKRLAQIRRAVGLLLKSENTHLVAGGVLAAQHLCEPKFMSDYVRLAKSDHPFVAGTSRVVIRQVLLHCLSLEAKRTVLAAIRVIPSGIRTIEQGLLWILRDLSREQEMILAELVDPEGEDRAMEAEMHDNEDDGME